MTLVRHAVYFKPVIGLGIKRYFHLRDMLNFTRDGILKLRIVNPYSTLLYVFQCIILTENEYIIKKSQRKALTPRNL